MASLYRMVCKCFYTRSSYKDRNLRIYENSVTQFNKQMDIVELLKTIRQLKTYFKCHLNSH